MIWSAVSWKWKRRRPFDSAQLFFLMKAVWKTHLEKAKVPSSGLPMKCGEHFPCTFILKAACGYAEKKRRKKLGIGFCRKHSSFFRKEGTNVNFIGRENTGNYGITCHLTIHSKGTGKYDLYLNPNGGGF